MNTPSDTINLDRTLARLGLALPECTVPGGNYSSVVVRGRTAYVAIQFPIRNGSFQYVGALGGNLTTAEGYAAMQLCALNVIAQLHDKIGWSRVWGINHLDIYYRAENGWDESPKVADGVSDLFAELLEQRGEHTRAILGVADLPRRFPVGLVTTVFLTEDASAVLP